MSIYIASHKPAMTPNGDLYKILALGGVNLGGNTVSDATGDNISHLNKYYCELTGTYWLWKNCLDDFVGLCHYRRYFNFIPTSPNHNIGTTHFNGQIKSLLEHEEQTNYINLLLQRYDIIVPRAYFEPHSVSYSYKSHHSPREWEVFLSIMDQYCGRNVHALDIERRIFYGNMLICKRELFNAYATQLFGVIDKVFAEVGVLDTRNEERNQPYRYPGYLAERFMSAFIKANRLTYYEAQILHIL